MDFHFILMCPCQRGREEDAMIFNDAKCYSFRVNRHTPNKQKQFNCSLHQHKLEQVQSNKYLGISITANLDWGQHISEITCTTSTTMGFLQLNLALALIGKLRRLHTNIGSSLAGVCST